MAYSGEDELNALVDSILQPRTDSANVSQVAPPQPSNSPSSTSSPSYGVSHSKASSTRHREHTATTYASSKDAEATAAAYGTHFGGHERALNNLVVVVPAAHGSSASGSRATAMHAADDADYYHDDHDDDDDDLNTLVERILAGRGSRRPPSPSSRHTTLPQHASSSAAITSPATSSLQRPAPQQQQQQQWGSSGTSTTSRLAGATRVEAGSHSLSRHSGGGDGGGGTSARMHAVVRRLALWQERREAKRVQAVYEALEREHQDCPFEPAIHHLPTVEAEDRRGDSARYPASHTNTISMSSSSSSASPPPLCEYVPSLQPLQQPVTGADAFVERLRRVQEERDALREAAEAQRLHFYDATTFRRDLTVPVPFELGDTRPRRVATATAAVAGVPSPLRRSVGRGGPPPPSPPNARTAATLSVHRSAAAAGAGTSPSMQRGGGGDGGRPADEEDERLTAENTFLSLAPLIRKTLLFDQRMEAQLHRATNSIRRTSGGE